MAGKPLVKPKKAVLAKKAKPAVITKKPKETYSQFIPFNTKHVADVQTVHTTEITMMVGTDKVGKLRPIKITNNLNAQDVTLKELNKFLRSDAVKAIDKKQPKSGEYECGDFARDLHNLAEKQGIRCAFVIIYYNHGTGHGTNAFNTKDFGLIFIDLAMKARYDLNRFVGKGEGAKGKNFYKVEGQEHWKTPSGRSRNIKEISVIW